MKIADRLLAIDVMRGMTIFFMIIVNTPGSWNYVYAPLRHAPWDGCTPTDLVFPFFVFIVGLSMSFSFRRFDISSRHKWIAKVLRRTILIFLIGLLLNAYPFFNKDFSQLRIFGVLQRIALAYGLGAFIVIFVKRKYLLGTLIGILIGYWLLLLSAGEGALTLAGNLVRTIDLALIGDAHMYHGYEGGIAFDPEGLLGAIPAAGTVLFGYLMGLILQENRTDHVRQIKDLVRVGLIAIVVAVAWHFAGSPINKPLWSSSYVLFAGGLGSCFLALLITIIDWKGWTKWTYVFRAFGLNPLISYALSGLVIKTLFLIKIGDQNVYGYLYQAFFQPVFGNHFGSLFQALTYTLFIWLFAWMLFLKKKVIKL